MGQRVRVRYPNRFEIFRLEALGEPPYLDTSAARHLYESGKALDVVPDEDPPAWSLNVSTKRFRFSVAYYTLTKTPLRKVTWEQKDGELLCRRTIDLFYPDGDPRGFVRHIDLFAVTQHLSTDGVVGVGFSSPLGDDRFRDVAGVELEGFRLEMPAFGEWDQLVSAGAPADVDRFGLDAIDTAAAYEEALLAQGRVDQPSEVTRGAGWRVPALDRGVMDAVDAMLAGEPTRRDIPVLQRGSARLLPLALEADPTSTGRDPHEEEGRMRVVADAIRGACEYREGQAITFDLNQRGTDRVGSYASALRRANATAAQYWIYRDGHGLVLAWTGDAAKGTRALALHVVPAGWVTSRRGKPAIDHIDVAWSAKDVARAMGAGES